MKTIFKKIALFIGAAMVGVAGYLLGLMMEFGVSFESAWWFLGLTVGGMILAEMSIGENHKTMSALGLSTAALAGISFSRMQFYIVYASPETVGLPTFFMIIIAILVIMAYELLIHAFPDTDTSVNTNGNDETE